MATEKKVLKVLLVDDDADLGAFMKLKLTKEAPHFSIAFVESGQECLDYLNAHEADCILSDYQMPEMDGMELLLALREAGSDVPVIFVTGQGNEEVAREAFKNGAYDYFTKDFGFAHFARIINSVEQAVKQSQANKAISEREFWIKESQKVARVGSYVVDIQTGACTTSDIMDDIFGIDDDYEKSLDGWAAIVHPKDRASMVKYLAEAITQKKRFEADYRIIRQSDGQERWVSGLGELVLDGDGNPVRMLGTIQDITERKQVEDALQASQKYLQTIIDTEPECVKLLSSGGTLLMMNRAGLAMIEADSLEQVKGKRIFDLIVPEHREAFKALGEEVFRGGSGTLGFDLVGFKGRRLRLETHAVPLRNEKDEIIALLGITHDVTERKRAEEALAESRAAYQALAENLPGIVYRIFIRENGRMQFMNRAAEGITGYTDKELLGGEVCKIEKLILPEDLKAVVTEVKLAVLENRPFMVEYRLKHKDGGIRHMLEQGTPIYGPDNEPLYIDGVIFDITDRKLATDALQESESMFKGVYASSPVGIELYNSEGRLIDANPACLSIFGLSDKEPVLGFDIFADPNLPEKAKEKLRAGGTVSFETTFDFGLVKNNKLYETSKSGKINLSLHLAPFSTKNDINNGYLLHVQDITERKKVEDELKKFKFIVEGAGEEFYLLDTSGNIIYANAAAAKSFGYTMDEMLKLKVSDFNPAYAPIFEEYVRELKERDVPLFETAHITKDGRTVPTELKAAYIQIGGNDYICTFARDISERKNLERQRADFHAMVTHDLKSPLATILGYSELISKTAQSNSVGDIDEMAKAVSRSGEKILKVVEDFLAAARLESGGIVVKPMPVEVAGLLLEVGNDFEPVARKKGVEFRADIPQALPLASLDKKQVERAVGNLLQNAFNYTPKGGEVRLVAEAVTYGDKKYLLVSVSDTGPGISQEDINKIFDKYYRSPKAAKTKGTGLGLAIVKAIAEAHGGRVEVESREGSGSTFRLFLPQ